MGTALLVPHVTAEMGPASWRTQRGLSARLDGAWALLAWLCIAGHPVWHGQMALGAQYGTARQDCISSMAWLDRTGHLVWHGLIGLGVDWAPSMAQLDSTGCPV